MLFLCLFSWDKPYVCMALLLICNILCIFLPLGKCHCQVCRFLVFDRMAYCSLILYSICYGTASRDVQVVNGYYTISLNLIFLTL